MSNPKILVCVDFDNTIVDCNTDREVNRLAKGKEIPEEILALSHEDKGWTRYMQELFQFLHSSGSTQEDYAMLLRGLPLVEGMRDLLRQMHESGDCELAVVSDANAFFVSCVLQHHGLQQAVAHCCTNPAEFDAEGCLRLRPFHRQTACSRCPPNLCKGAALAEYVARRAREGAHFCRTLYIGDGLGDVCPALRLGPDDYVFARSGFRLLRSLEKMPAKDVKATVVPWETAYDIRD